MKFSFFVISLIISLLYATKAFSLPSKWCIDKGTHYQSGALKPIMPIPPMLEGNINVCPSKHLKEIGIEKVKEYYSNDIGKKRLCEIIHRFRNTFRN